MTHFANSDGMTPISGRGGHGGRKPVWTALALSVLLGVFAVGRSASIDAGTNVVAEAFSGIDWRQAANEDPNLGEAHWIGSILQQNNSRYFEGMSVPQRLILLDITPTDDHRHSLEFNHEATKGGIHAYDYLTSWDQAIEAANRIPSLGAGLLSGLANDACGPEIGPQASTAICNALRSSGNVGSARIPLNMGTLEGDDIEVSILNYEIVFGPREVEIYGLAAGPNDPDDPDLAIRDASLDFTGYSGNSDSIAHYRLVWTSSSKQILIEFAGHLAAGDDSLTAGIGYGTDRGAGSVSGAPYHIALESLDDGSVGSMDNQIQSVLEVPGCPFECCGDSDCDEGLRCCLETQTCAECCGDQCTTDGDCDDGNDCTVDTCENCECVHDPICDTDGDCDDGLFCNGPETCDDGCCKPGLPPCGEGQCCESENRCGCPSCDDGNDCTVDTCVGCECVHDPICDTDADCDDGSFCNGKEKCDNGCCKPGTPPCAGGTCCESVNRCGCSSCDDGNDCTVDRCENCVCVHGPRCPVGRNCCDDDIDCPEGSDGRCTECRNGCCAPRCSVGVNCCDDDSDCPEGSDGRCMECQDGCCGPVTCPMDDDCPRDCPNCDKTSRTCFRCTQETRSICDDGVFCNGEEGCDDGKCAAGPLPCAEPQLCDEVDDECRTCTDDDAECADPLFCNGDESCDDGLCVAGPSPCSDDQLCCEDTDTCASCCDDSDCDDGAFCTGVEVCEAGECLLGTSPCAERQICDEDNDECRTCTDDDAECADGLFCNGDEGCDDGLCVPGPSPCSDDQSCCEDTETCASCCDDADCDDGDFCNGVESCDDGLCVPGPSPCADDESCCEDTDTCGSFCEDADCDNGLFCDGQETCVGGSCCRGSRPCESGIVFCDEEGDDCCIECITDLDCGDDQGCNADGCCAEPQPPMCLPDGSCPSDGVSCNGEEFCNMTTNMCESRNSPCIAGQRCNEVADCCEVFIPSSGCGGCGDGVWVCVMIGSFGWLGLRLHSKGRRRRRTNAL